MSVVSRIFRNEKISQMCRTFAVSFRYMKPETQLTCQNLLRTATHEANDTVRVSHDGSLDVVE